MWKKFTAIVVSSLCIATSNVSYAQGHIVPCTNLTNVELNKLENVYISGDIRVFYTTTAPASGLDHRLPTQSQVDNNANGIPDYVENIATQANSARRAYNLLGFRDPLLSPKFRAAEYIDINILNMAGNGLAYDSPVSYTSAPNRGTSCTLRIDISALLENQTVGSPPLQSEFTKHWFVAAHEMFHLYQYGQTLFKRSWVAEPTARLAEYALRLSAHYPLGTPTYQLPSTAADFNTQVIANPNGADANRFWSRIAVLLEGEHDTIRLPASLMSTTYTDGQLVFKDNKFTGFAFIAAALNSLGAKDAVVSSVNSRNPYDWAEADQTSTTNDPYILDALQETIRATGTANAEINAFLAIP
jgi:hypothetical protein